MKISKILLMAAVVSSLFSVSSFAQSNAKLVKEGKKIFLSKKLGNCLACHNIAGMKVPQAGALGPKLAHLSSYPTSFLYNKIYNPYTTNPVSQMPPFGKNAILSNQQIKAVVAFLKTIK